MKPLFPIVVAILVLTANAHPKNTKEVKELPKNGEPSPLAEDTESDPQNREERCTTCSGNVKLNLKSPKDVLAAIQQFPGAEVHTQQSFEGCSSDKGCAGLKVKDGRVVEKFGNSEAFQAAASQNEGNEFTFHAAGNLGNLLDAGLNGEGSPFWWMNQQNSPFKNAGAGGNYEKFSKSSSSSFSTTGNGGSAGLDLGANPFLNGEFSKVAGGFGTSGGAGFTSAGANAQESKPGYQSSSFESSSFSSSSKGDVDLSQNPFLNGGVNKFGQSGFQAQGSFGAGQSQFGAGQGQSTGFGAQNSQSGFNQASFGSSSKFGATGSGGYTGSSPSPFTASTAGSNVNLIQNTQKASEFDFTQQTQQNIDEAFQHTGNVNAHEHSGGDLQQTCAGQGYVCVHKAQCNNGVVNTNGGALLQANTQKQYCNVRTEICCRIETSSLAGAGSLQGSLGVGSATFSGSSNQGAGLFASGQNSASQSGSFNGQASGFNGQAAGTYNQNSGSAFNQNSGSTSGFGSSFNKATTSGFGSQGQFGSGSTSFGSDNRGVLESSSSSFESSRGNKFSGYGGSTLAPATNKFGNNFNNEVFKATSQSNFVGTDSFSAGSEQAGLFRPGASGSGLKPGIPYLPPIDSSTLASNSIGSTAFVTTPQPRPTTVRPFTTPRPFVPSTSAPGYLPPQGESTNNRETRLPPNPTYTEGQIILDESRQPTRPPTRFTPGPSPSDIPAGCAAALKCTPIEFCTAEGVISNTSVVLTRDQDAYRVPLTDCRDIESGRIGKCCRDPFYTDPWPTNQLGKWVPGVFGGNDGRYVPDSRGSPTTNVRPGVTVRPPQQPVTGSVYLNNFRTTKPTAGPTLGPNQLTPGFPTSTPGSFIQKGQGQYEQRGQGSYSTGGQGQVGIGGQGQFGVAGLGQTTQGGQFGQGSGFTQTTSSAFGQTTRGQGQSVSQGAGLGVTQGQGSYSQGGRGQYDVQGSAGQNQYTQTQGVSQGQGLAVSQGVGQSVTQGQGIGVIRGSGQSGTNGQGFAVQQGLGQGFIQGQGQTVSQGAGFGISQGSGSTVSRGQGQTVSQGAGFGISQGSGSTVSRGQGQTVSQGTGQVVSQGQAFGVSRGQGQIVSQGQGVGASRGQGQAVLTGQGVGVSQGSGQRVSQGQGFSVSQGFGTGLVQGGGIGVTGGQGQYASQGQGQSVSQGAGFGVSQGAGFGVSQGAGFGVSQGQGQSVTQGFGQSISQGTGYGIRQGSGQTVSQGSGFGVSQGQGQGVSQGGGFGISQGGFGSRVEGGLGFNQGLGFGVIRGQGQSLLQGQGEKLTQGVGSGEIRGEGFQVTQGGGFGVENEYSESVRRVFLSRYSSGGQCGVLNPQKPYGNRGDLEADFAEIPWQAMVLLQTNRSLLCGGVITRPDVVVTSAACVDGLDAKNVLIKGGEWKLGIDDEPLPFQIVQVKTILRHPFYKRGNLKYDAAILVLNEDLRFAKNIYPICLPGAKETLDAFYNGAGECIVTGWGKTVLQAHLKGSIMNSVNVSLVNPGECEAKLQAEYPHLLEQYDQDSCACGQPTNPANNICKVDIGSALACTTGDGHFVFRGVYSWDSGCQVGNQIAGFWKFDVEWYEWAIGLIESVRFAKYTTGTQITKNKYSGQISSSGIKTSQVGFKGGVTGVKEVSGAKELNSFAQGLGQFGFGSTKYSESSSGLNGGVSTEIKGPISNTFSATYSEKKVFQSEPKFVTYTTKPEIVTFTTKPEYFTYTTKPKIVTYTTKPEIVTYTTKPEIVTFTTKPEIVTYTTKPKIVTYTTKPQIIRYETSGSGTNPQYVAPGVSFNPSFTDVVAHKHSASCKCLEGKK